MPRFAFGTAPDIIGSFAHRPDKGPISVRPHSSMDSTSIYSSNLFFAKDYSHNIPGIDWNKVCRGCNNPYCNCMERKWRSVCLHSVIDYFEENEYNGIQREGVYDAYYKTFRFMVKTEVLKRTRYWERINEILIPQCMIEGSLSEAYEMMQFELDLTYEYFLGQRVHNVQHHLDRIHGISRTGCGCDDNNVNK